MDLANPLKLLGISILLAAGWPLGSAADEQRATLNQIAQIDSSHSKLKTIVEDSLRVRVESALAVRVDAPLADRTTALLRERVRVAARTRADETPPAAVQIDSESSAASGSRANTKCTMKGNTFECTLREPADR
jgi:hypothetical protein